MAKGKRPLTQREMAQNKVSVETVLIKNVSGQMVPIQLRSPRKRDGDRLGFYEGEQSVPLMSGKQAVFPADRLYESQIKNLQLGGHIKIQKLVQPS